jgi:hypothetical protein
MYTYTDSDESLTEVFLDVLEQEDFARFQFLKFKLIFGLKRRIKGGKLVLASIEAPGPKLKYLSKDKIAIDGYDLLLIVDQKAWELANNVDRVRIIRHELKHITLTEQGAVKVVGHEVEDFYSEIARNADDPEWGVRLTTLTNDMYEQEKIMLKESKNG